MVAPSTVKSSASTLRRAAASIRPPIILQISKNALVAGRAGGTPAHTEPLLMTSSHSTTATSKAESLYRYYVESIRSVLYRVASPTIDGTFVLVVSKDVIPSRNWKTAIAQCILQEFGTAVSFVSTLHTIPIALAMVAPAIWVVEMDSLQESATATTRNLQCMITVEDHALDYTYQSAVTKNEWPRALALSLLQCPLSHRKTAIQNMVVVGDASSAIQLAKSFHRFLLGEEDAEPVEEETAEDPASNDDSCYYAIDTSPLRTLASQIGVIECPNGSLAWTGASIWAARKASDPKCWHKSIPDS